MDSIRHKSTEVDKANLGFVIKEIAGSGLSDQTIFKYVEGSVLWTCPITPTHLLGDRMFKSLRVKNFTGLMTVNRHEGRVVNVTFT